MRILSAFLVSLVINLLLFLLMQAMITGQGSRFTRTEDDQGIEFIRLKQRQEPLNIKERAVPKRPPPKAPPRSPKMKMAAPVEPETKRLQTPGPQIRVPMRLGGGPFLGEFISASGPGDSMAGVIETDVIPLVRIPPRYPQRALRSGIEGAVTVEFTITRDGSVMDPMVIKSVPPKVFDHAAIRSVRKWRFKPKLVEGKPVQRRAVQTIRFSLNKD